MFSSLLSKAIVLYSVLKIIIINSCSETKLSIYIYDFSKCCQYTPHMLYVFKNAIFTLFACVRYFFQEQHALTIHTVKLSTWDVSCIINIMNASFIQYMKRYTYFIGYHICTFFTPYLLSIYMYSRCYMIDLLIN